MFPWLAHRLGLYAVGAWVALTLNFFIPRWMPGDPAVRMFARLQGELSPDGMAALRETFGFTDGPLHEQYLTWLSHALRGDLGVSIAMFPTPVSEVIGVGLLWTILLGITSVAISFGLGTALGALLAWRRGGWADRTLPPLLGLLGAFPYFWLAMAALWLFGFQLGWFPVRGAWGAHTTPGFNLTFLHSVLAHLTLPALTIVAATLGGWTLGMRQVMIGVLDEEHLRHALTRGLSPQRIFLHHAVRNAMIPNLTGFGMAIGFVFNGALLTEMVFAWPGQGYLLLQAVRAQDYPLMQGLFLTITLAVLAANAAVDVLTAWLDPRTA